MARNRIKSASRSRAKAAPLIPARIMELGLGFWSSKTLLSAVELGLFTELGQGPAKGPDIARRLSLHPRSALDFLDTLVALGVLERKGERYSNTRESEHFLNRKSPVYIGGVLAMANARLYGFWGSLTEGLRTGQPQNEIKHGGNFFQTLYGIPELLRQFLQAMTGLSMGTSIAIARKFPWKKYKSFADIGTAQGGLPVQVALRHPHLSGIGFDLPVVQPIFEEYVNSFKLGGRIRFAPGTFFQDPLPSADVLVMGHILHDWNLEEKQQLIAAAYSALPRGGALLVFEAIIDDERRKNAFGLLMSLNMLIETPGGFDFTGRDGARWMRQAGFRKTYVEHLAGPDSMVVGIK